ncbi:DnaD domain protein [Peribacillus asahii]|uniref:DnaD domain protein n=1 Tax=Peribacillus asahii TaxID=228899 RepID=UPI0020793492|nr:DnaD domain protein [Peribacillus asahii]USK61307.1 DnaD domain protein [Peribacillus asahii]
MNYIREINAFYDWLELNELPKSAVLLWHALMHLNNKSGWQETFTVARSVIEAKTGLKKDAYYKARNQLKQSGLIDFKERGTKATAFKIFSLLSEKQTAPPTIIIESEKNKQKEEDEDTTVDRILELLEKSKILEKKDITEFLRDDIDDVITTFGFEQPEEMIIEAIKDAARGNGRTWKFVYMKLVDWKKKGIKTKLDLENQSGEGEANGKKVYQHRTGYGRPSSKSAEQALREAEEARRAWGG